MRQKRSPSTRGTAGAAEAFGDGAWDADDLVAFVRIPVRFLGCAQIVLRKPRS